MDGDVAGRVECYSGSEYPERPVAFYWQGKRFEVEKILTDAITPPGKSFRVLTADGHEFTLSYDQQLDCWKIDPG
ncbi:MAG: hypothetical protein ABFD24_11715 [Anaerolineaceae bacterium]